MDRPRRFSPLILLVGFVTLFLHNDIAHSEGPQLAAGAGHTALLTKGGSVWAWGSNTYGQIGDGTNIERHTPVRLTNLLNIEAIACGERHTAVVLSDGTLFTWGGNNHGQLGNGSGIDSNIPTQVSGLATVVAIAAGWWHTLALKSDGSVWTWGRNSEGQLGNGATADSNIPVQVLGLINVVSVAAGWGHSLALKSDGTVWAWGNNRSGQLGLGHKNAAFLPEQVKGPNPDSYLSGIRSIACGGWHSIAARQDGSLWAWGGNSNGQLGDGDLKSAGRDLPVPVKDIDGVGYLTGVLEAAGGWMHTAVIKTDENQDNMVLSWGGNFFGQIGNGTFNKTSLPIQARISMLKGLLSNGNSPFYLKKVVAIATGFYHSVALRRDGAIWSWGDNSCGQIGDGTTITRIMATKLPYRFK